MRIRVSEGVYLWATTRGMDVQTEPNISVRVDYRLIQRMYLSSARLVVSRITVRRMRPDALDLTGGQRGIYALGKP